VAEEKRVDPYLFEAGFERTVVALLASNREFYERLGVFVEPEAFEDPSAKEIARLTKLMAKTMGRGPGSRDVVLQSFAEFSRAGKATIDQKLIAAEYLEELPTDFDSEPYAAVLADVIQRRLQTRILLDATSATTRGKVISEKTAEQFARLREVGRVQTFGSEGLDGDISTPPKTTTGVEALDFVLEGGLVENGVGVFCGGPKAGKSMSLSGVTAAKYHDGKFVAYLSTELPVAIQRARVCAAIVDCPIRSLQQGDVEAMAKLREIRKDCETRGGLIQFKRAELDPKKAIAGWTFDDVLFWLDRLAKEFKRHPDVLVIDYADHLFAKGVKDTYTTGFIVYTHMINAAQKRGMQTWTAAQGTRQKKEATHLGLYDFSDSMHKVRLVDLGITISPGDKGFSILKVVADRYVGATGTELEPLPIAHSHGYLVHSRPIKKTTPEPSMFEGYDFGGDDVLH
jgi:hypothetical protein